MLWCDNSHELHLNCTWCSRWLVYAKEPKWRSISLLTSWSTVLIEKLIVSQQFPWFLLSPKVRCHIYKNQPLDPLLSHMNPVHTFIPPILILSSRLCLGHTNGLFTSCFLTKILYAFLISPLWSICPRHFTVLDLIALIKSGEAYKLRSLSLCSSFFHPPVASCL